MLYEYMRIFKRSGASFTDLSLENQDLAATIGPITDSEYLYVGQELPFNTLFFWITTANPVTASLSIEYWDGTTWRAAQDILDGTKTSSGVTFAKSGLIQWDLNDDYGWQQVYETDQTNSPAEFLNEVQAKNLYWIRIQPSATLTDVLIKEITYTFTSGQELKSYDVEIDTYLTSFATGKTDWNEQIIAASKHVVLDLKRMGVVYHRGQILRIDDVSIPATLWTLILIYLNLGPSYKDRRDELMTMYKEALNTRYKSIDENKDGKLDPRERMGSVRTMIR